MGRPIGNYEQGMRALRELSDSLSHTHTLQSPPAPFPSLF